LQAVCTLNVSHRNELKLQQRYPGFEVIFWMSTFNPAESFCTLCRYWQFMRAVLSIILFVICLRVVGQDTSYNSFSQQKKYTDSLVNLIDVNKELIERKLVGKDSIFGPYNGKFLYNPEDKAILKVECHFEFDTSGSKILFYSNDNFIKAVDNKVIYYCINDSLVNEFGVQENTSQAMNILVFQKSLSNILKVLVSD
jgi:hypothetical protein